MDSILEKIVGKLWALMKKQLKEEFDEQKSEIATVVVTTMIEVAGQLTVNTVDKVTEIIPGKVDDWVVDQIKNSVRDRLAQFGIHI